MYSPRHGATKHPFDLLKANKPLILALGIALILIAGVILVFSIFSGRDVPSTSDMDQPPRVVTPPEPPPPPPPPPEPAPEPDPEEEPPSPDLTGMPTWMLTGLPIDEEHAQRRPMAVVINNSRDAWPQSGLPSADVIYEVLTEGDITRLLALFHSALPEKIGPVRSTRDYFSDMALNHDAIFVYHGGTVDGYERVRSLIPDNLDGMSLEGTVFWRDRTYPAWTGNTRQRAMEHSSYTGRQRIVDYIQQENMRQRVGDAEDYGFTFGDIPEEVARAGSTENLSVVYSTAYIRNFIYDPQLGHYLVENRLGAHTDADTREQLTANNILIQRTQKRVVDPVAGYRSVATVGSGDGYLVADGQYYELRWEKTSHTSPMRWYFKCDTPLVLTRGKTWICVFQDTGTIRFD